MIRRVVEIVALPAVLLPGGTVTLLAGAAIGAGRPALAVALPVVAAVVAGDQLAYFSGAAVTSWWRRRRPAADECEACAAGSGSGLAHGGDAVARRRRGRDALPVVRSPAACHARAVAGGGAECRRTRRPFARLASGVSPGSSALPPAPSLWRACWRPGTDPA